MTTTESAAASYGSAPGKTEYMEGSKDPVIALGANAECSDLVFEEGKFPVDLELPKRERSVIKFWRKIDAFKTSLELSKDKPPSIFYDGPPFATGLPHYGHILAGTVKDIIARYATMNGHYVERKFGWDTHGLPIEHLIDKKLGINTSSDVLKCGIANYNEECRKVVLKCADDWNTIVERVGRWVNFVDCYKTMDLSFMESVWWCFKRLYDLGAIYRSYRVMPYSTAVHSTLSNFEVGLNYLDVSDPSVIVSFPLLSQPDTALLSWTTTPWTLPTNLALCVNPDETYVTIKDVDTGNKYILMERRLEELSGSLITNYEVMNSFLGRTLSGLKYKPIFDFLLEQYSDRAFVILCSTEAVTSDVGTGVVQMAPAHGEIDFVVCKDNGIFDVKDNISSHFDESGKFTDAIKPYENMYFKEADKLIIKDMKQMKRLIKNSRISHSYPYCWRSNTPIMYIALPCWFVRVSNISHELVQNLSETRWVPEYVGSKRFLNWVKNAKDWNISRERYWGTPIPLWQSEDGEEVVAVGSIEELKELSGCGEVSDLHCHNIDHIKIPSKKGNGMLTRVPYVFDCWFESGSVPYSQFHYPFKQPELHRNKFPAEFVSEGIDQTRGWFYTLLVISSLISKCAPYKNVIVTGHILAEDGKKMSKSKGNYPDPMVIVEKYGADVLRLYLINSPVLYGENLRFNERGLRETISKVFTPWYNSVRFFSNQVDLMKKVHKIKFEYNPNINVAEGNYLDKWALSEIQTLVSRVKTEVDAYRLYGAVPLFEDCVNNITNWYIRLNRRRLKCESGVNEACYSLNVLFEFLLAFCIIMAPFTPFFSEVVYANLKNYCTNYLSSLGLKNTQSVHFLDYPSINSNHINTDAERAIMRLKEAINLGRLIREKHCVMFKIPCSKMVVIVGDEVAKNDLLSLYKYIKEEMNVKELVITADSSKYNVKMRLEPNYKTLGNVFKSKISEIKAALNTLTDNQIQKFVAEGKIELLGHTIDESQVRLFYNLESDNPNIKIQHSKNTLVLLDTTPLPELINEGHMRDMVNQIQKLRKKASLTPTDKVLYRFTVVNGEKSLLDNIIREHIGYFESVLRSSLSEFDKSVDGNKKVIASEQHMVADITYEMYFLEL